MLLSLETEVPLSLPSCIYHLTFSLPLPLLFLIIRWIVAAASSSFSYLAAGSIDSAACAPPTPHMFVFPPKARLEGDQPVKGLVRRHRHLVNCLFAHNSPPRAAV